MYRRFVSKEELENLVNTGKIIPRGNKCWFFDINQVESVDYQLKYLANVVAKTITVSSTYFLVLNIRNVKDLSIDWAPYSVPEGNFLKTINVTEHYNSRGYCIDDVVSCEVWQQNETFQKVYEGDLQGANNFLFVN